MRTCRDKSTLPGQNVIRHVDHAPNTSQDTYSIAAEPLHGSWLNGSQVMDNANEMFPENMLHNSLGDAGAVPETSMGVESSSNIYHVQSGQMLNQSHGFGSDSLITDSFDMPEVDQSLIDVGAMSPKQRDVGVSWVSAAVCQSFRSHADHSTLADLLIILERRSSKLAVRISNRQH